jgi:hypothetical protein
VISLRCRFISRRTTTRHTIKRWLTCWIVDDWVNIRFFFWSLNVCITSRDFSNVLSISKCLISFTNRLLNMQTFMNTSFLLIDWNTLFSTRSFIFFCLKSANWEWTIWSIKSNLKTKARASNDIEAKAKARSTIVFNTNLKYAVNAKYFRDRSRSRLNKMKKISNSDSSSFEIAN